MKLARHLSALSLATVAVLLAGGPLGCELLGYKPPEIPQTPQLPEAPEVPEPPAEPEPPTAPQGPKVDVPPDHEGGVCCMRAGAVEQVCGVGVKRCCTLKYDDPGDCEDEGGFWFHTVEGCAGAC